MKTIEKFVFKIIYDVLNSTIHSDNNYYDTNL